MTNGFDQQSWALDRLQPEAPVSAVPLSPFRRERSLEGNQMQCRTG
jgi:hypothetical protein